MVKKIFPYFVIFLLLIPLIFLVLRPGFWVSDDGGWMIVRLSAFHQTLRTGQFPVRFLYPLNHGYGYPVLDFLYPLPFYLGEIIHLLGFGFVDSIKLLFAGSILFSAFAMYLFAGKWGKLSGLVAALVYTLAPYRLFDVFNRGSLGEAVAFVFPPLIFYFLDKENLILASLFTAALIVSHNVIAFLFFPVILLYVIWHKFPSLFSLLFSLFSLILSAWFWLPALFDLQYTRAASVSVSNFSQYFISFDNSYLILPLVFILVTTLLIHIIRVKDKKEKTGAFFWVVGVVSLIFSLSVSGPVWQASLFPKLVQFPWRFLSVTVFCAAVLAGGLMNLTRSFLLISLGLFFVLPFLAFSVLNLKFDRTYLPDSYYQTNDDTTTVKNEYLPKWVKSDPASRPLAKLEIASGVGRVLSDTQLVMDTPGVVKISTVYFPGVALYIDGLQSSFSYLQDGILRANILPGPHVLETRFEETPLRLLADGVSLIGIVLIGGFYVSSRARKID